MKYLQIVLKLGKNILGGHREIKTKDKKANYCNCYPGKLRPCLVEIIHTARYSFLVYSACCHHLSLSLSLLLFISQQNLIVTGFSPTPPWAFSPSHPTSPPVLQWMSFVNCHKSIMLHRGVSEQCRRLSAFLLWVHPCIVCTGTFLSISTYEYTYFVGPDCQQLNEDSWSQEAFLMSCCCCWWWLLVFVCFWLEEHLARKVLLIEQGLLNWNWIIFCLWRLVDMWTLT